VLPRLVPILAAVDFVSLRITAKHAGSVSLLLYYRARVPTECLYALSIPSAAFWIALHFVRNHPQIRRELEDQIIGTRINLVANDNEECSRPLESMPAQHQLSNVFEPEGSAQNGH
jgi:hypothetical protein